MTIAFRRAGWILFVLLSVVRPGVDGLDRWLVTACWNIPSEWNAVADIAIKSGAVDSTIAGAPAPWRQASILPAGSKNVAVVTLSDMHRSRATFLSERYEILGTFERTTTDPALVTDEARGYKPLTHIWPIVVQHGRVLTLVTFAPLASNPPTAGMFAYLAVGPRDTELLFLCRLRWSRNSIHGLLDRKNLTGEGPGDLALYFKGQRERPPIATFSWTSATREYNATLADEARPLVSWWSTTPGSRVMVRLGESIDDTVAVVAAGLAPPK